MSKYTAILHKEDDMYVAHCPDYDVASQGHTIEEAKSNLLEALELFLENASEEEKLVRFNSDIYITTIST